MLREELGAGGMAVVFRAEDTALRRDVAIKVLYPQIVRRKELAGRFLREARAAAALDHPHILKVFDVGGAEAEGGEPAFLVMELVRGVTLREFLERSGTPHAEVVAMVGAVLARALAAAHGAGVTHRDVKPANVMLAENGRLVLCDFGVARLANDDAVVTQTGAMLGTPAFMSPEQAMGQEVDARSDVYSLGATLYQLATGVLPFTGPTPAVLAAVVRGDLISPLRKNAALGKDLARVIERAMARDAAERYADAAALAVALEELAGLAGFVDGEAELAAYFAAPGEWNERAMPAIVSSCMTRAKAAAARREYARALGLADRVLALQPDHAEASSLVASVGSGARRWRRTALLAGVLALCAVAVVASVAVVRRPGAPRTAVAGVGADAQLAAMTASDAGLAPIVAVTPDAATMVVVVAAAADGGLSAKRPLVRTRADAGVAQVVVSHAPPDAGTPVAVAVEDAVIDEVSFTGAWCDVYVDGTAYGRSPHKTPISVKPGKHTVECRQGEGGPSATRAVDLNPGEHIRVRGPLLSPVEVTVAVRGGTVVTVGGVRHANGSRFKQNPGKQKVQVLKDEQVVVENYIDIPNRACTIHDRPELACDE